jgi:hypothetical protein
MQRAAPRAVGVGVQGRVEPRRGFVAAMAAPRVATRRRATCAGAPPMTGRKSCVVQHNEEGVPGHRACAVVLANTCASAAAACAPLRRLDKGIATKRMRLLLRPSARRAQPPKVTAHFLVFATFPRFPSPLPRQTCSRNGTHPYAKPRTQGVTHQLAMVHRRL